MNIQMQALISPQNYYADLKHTEKMKEFYNEPPCTHHFGPTIEILLYLSYHLPIHPSIHSLIQIVFWYIQSKLQTLVHITPRQFSMHIIN